MSIHINPKNKGKFNALKKRTGKTTEQLTHSKNPLTKKRAIFAQNARKWKHEEGGYLEGEPTKRVAVTTVRNRFKIPLTDLNVIDQMIELGYHSDRQALLKMTPEQRQAFLPIDGAITFEKVKKGTANQGGYRYYNKAYRNLGTDITSEGKIIVKDANKNLVKGQFPTHYEDGGFLNFLNSERGISGIGAGANLGTDFIDMFANPDRYDPQGNVNINEGAAAGKGALKGAAAGMMFGPIGAGIGAVVGGVGSLLGAKAKEKRMNKQIALDNAVKLKNNQIGSRLAGLTTNQSYTPVARQGGFTVYKGQTHEGPDGGIYTDEQGNPTKISNNNPIALTENNEVARFMPDDGSTYIYSDSLGFAKPATHLVNKYKLNKSNSQYKNDLLLRTAVDKQFDNLQTAQELLKEKRAPKSTQFKNGGMLPTFEGDESYSSILPSSNLSWWNSTSLQNKYNNSWLGSNSIMKNLSNPNRPKPQPSDFTRAIARMAWGNSVSPMTKEDRVSQENSPIGDIAHLYNTGIGGMYYTPSFNAPKAKEPIYPWSQEKVTLDIPKSTPIKPQPSTPTTTIPKKRIVDPTRNYAIKADWRKLLPDTPAGLIKSSLVRPTVSSTTESDFNPTLSPLGHVLSGVGQLADYASMRRNKPLEVNIPRVGAERISLASQRLANERNASAARSINTTVARNLGLNAGATMANTAVANTGVNRLLGQQNAQLLENETNTNAQLRQQANMLNAELGAQEALFNTQTKNAYRARLAQMNPLGNLGRTAASYFADNAAYGQQYDMMKMVAPNYGVYEPDDYNTMKWLLGKGPKIKAKG